MARQIKHTGPGYRSYDTYASRTELQSSQLHHANLVAHGPSDKQTQFVGRRHDAQQVWPGGSGTHPARHATVDNPSRPPRYAAHTTGRTSLYFLARRAGTSGPQGILTRIELANC